MFMIAKEIKKIVERCATPLKPVLFSLCIGLTVSGCGGDSGQSASPTVDTTSPIITLVGQANVTVTQNTGYNDAGATASDNVDGNITSSIVSGGTFTDTSVVGAFTMTYNVRDAAQNAATQVVRNITVVAPNNAPVAKAGIDQYTKAGFWVGVNGYSSYDIDGDILTYQWAIISMPVDSYATISYASSGAALLKVDVVGGILY